MLTCKDEQHRRDVLKAARTAFKRLRASVRISCLLSSLQKANKDEVYHVGKAQKALNVVDWGDRVAIFQQTNDSSVRGRRWVIDLA